MTHRRNGPIFTPLWNRAHLRSLSELVAQHYEGECVPFDPNAGDNACSPPISPIIGAREQDSVNVLGLERISYFQ